MKKNDNKPDAGFLRQKAEERLKKKLAGTLNQQPVRSLDPGTLKLIHELEVHQIELEMQNEELVLTKRLSEAAADKYSELYDFAPSGYYTLSREGAISELNLLGSNMLGKNREQLKNRRFGLFVSQETMITFNHFFKKIFQNKTKESCELILIGNGNAPMNVHLSGIINGDGTQCLITATDITERIQSEKSLQDLHDALKRSYSLLEATFESIHSGILVVSSQGKVIKTNATFAKMWNIPADVLATGEDNALLDYILNQLSYPGEFLSKVNELYGKPDSETFDQIYFKDGRIFERISKPMYLDGLPQGRVWSFLDITDRKLADEALREERWRLDKILEASLAGTWEWNVRTGDAVFNERWAQILGYTIEELAPVSIKTWQTLVHPEDLEQSNLLLDRHYAGELPYYNCECRMKHKDGHWVWIHDRGSVMTHTSDGKPLMMFGTHTDISDRKKIEELLLISQRNFNQLVGQLNDLIWKANGDGSGIMDLNNSFEKIFGIPASKFTVKPELWIDVVHPDDRKFAEESIRILFEKGNASAEYRVIRPDGSIIWLRDRKSIIYDQDGTPVQMGGIATDITELKMKEAEIVIKNDQLTLANSEKDKFFSIIAHDLRSPFNALLGFSQLLVAELDTLTLKEIQTIALSMRNSATNLFHLLENLLEWSRIRRGVTNFEPGQLLLKPIIDESLKSNLESSIKKGIEIKLDIPELIEVYADIYMLKSTIRNLLSNAVKFTNKGGSVVLSAYSLPGNSVEISIKDSGIGMSRKILDNIFRLDEQTSRKGTEGEPSSGLGLIICKEFIEKNGGKLWIESEENKGSTFYFTLPGKIQETNLKY